MTKKPYQLKLKIAWFKNFLGLAIDQVNLDQQYSLTPYYFWPKTEAWEQLKLELDSKSWLTQNEKLNILKITSNVMEYWLSYRNTRTAQDLIEDFEGVEIITVDGLGL
jgi:30S ribosomal protein 3